MTVCRCRRAKRLPLIVIIRTGTAATQPERIRNSRSLLQPQDAVAVWANYLGCLHQAALILILQEGPLLDPRRIQVVLVYVLNRGINHRFRHPKRSVGTLLTTVPLANVRVTHQTIPGSPVVSAFRRLPSAMVSIQRISLTHASLPHFAISKLECTRIPSILPHALTRQKCRTPIVHHATRKSATRSSSRNKDPPGLTKTCAAAAVVVSRAYRRQTMVLLSILAIYLIIWHSPRAINMLAAITVPR